MHRADVIEGPWLVEDVGELLAAVDRLRSEGAVGTDDVVRLLVLVDPADCRAWRDRQYRRHELEALDRNLGFADRGDLLLRLLGERADGPQRQERRSPDGQAAPRQEIDHRRASYARGTSVTAALFGGAMSISRMPSTVLSLSAGT